MSKHLALPASLYLQEFFSSFVVQIHPTAEQSAHSRDPKLLGALDLEELEQHRVGLRLVEIKTLLQVDPLCGTPFSFASLSKSRLWRAKHFPNQRLLVVDQLGNAQGHLIVEGVDQVHHLLADVERELNIRSLSFSCSHSPAPFLPPSRAPLGHDLRPDP